MLSAVFSQGWIAAENFIDSKDGAVHLPKGFGELLFVFHEAPLSRPIEFSRIYDRPGPVRAPSTHLPRDLLLLPWTSPNRMPRRDSTVAVDSFFDWVNRLVDTAVIVAGDAPASPEPNLQPTRSVGPGQFSPDPQRTSAQHKLPVVQSASRRADWDLDQVRNARRDGRLESWGDVRSSIDSLGGDAH